MNILTKNLGQCNIEANVTHILSKKKSIHFAHKGCFLLHVLEIIRKKIHMKFQANELAEYLAECFMNLNMSHFTFKIKPGIFYNS